MAQRLFFLLAATQIKTTSVNVGAENRGKGAKAKKEVRIDVDVEGIVHADILEELSISDTFDYEDELFDTDGKPKNLGIAKLPYDREYNDHIITISADDKGEVQAQEYNTKKIHKFSAELQPGRQAKLHMQIQIYPENAVQAWKLIQMLKYDLFLQVTKPAQGDIDSVPDPEPKASPKGKAAKKTQKKASKKTTAKAAEPA